MEYVRVYVGLIVTVKASTFEEAEDKVMEHVKITCEDTIDLEHKSIEGMDEI